MRGLLGLVLLRVLVIAIRCRRTLREFCGFRENGA